MKRILALLFLIGCSSAFLMRATPNATIYLTPYMNATTQYSIMLYKNDGNATESIKISINGAAANFAKIEPATLVLMPNKWYNITITVLLPNDTPASIDGYIYATTEMTGNGTMKFATATSKKLVIYPQKALVKVLDNHAVSDALNNSDSPNNVVYAKDYLGYAPYAVIAMILIGGAWYFLIFRKEEKEVIENGKDE